MVRKKHNRIHLSPLTQKILLLIGSGLAIGLSGNPNQYFRIIREARRGWGEISDRAARDNIQKLYASGYITLKKTSDDLFVPTLTKKGTAMQELYSLQNLQIPRLSKWDGVWRMVVFDIPESLRKRRVIFSEYLIYLGLYRVQKSIFTYPYPCRKEVDHLARLCKVQNHVRYIHAQDVDKDVDMRSFFRKKSLI